VRALPARSARAAAPGAHPEHAALGLQLGKRLSALLGVCRKVFARLLDEAVEGGALAEGPAPDAVHAAHLLQGGHTHAQLCRRLLRVQGVSGWLVVK
jgi:hypothetical protein